VDLAVLTIAVARHDGLVDDDDEPVRAISAITLATRDMAASVAFYEQLGFHLLYGGRGSPFSSFRVGGGYLNLQADDAWVPQEAVWGRVIFHVDDVDAMYERTLTAGLTPSAPPADAPWRERFFHIRDPDGHELSFARPLPEGSGDQSARGSK
jgi:catechol 2,3-dioxygenase-like lactoylglutathione lyase family enzyme